MRILFTSVGRRVELIQAYKNAASRCGIDVELFGGDTSCIAPALQFCDYTVILPPIKDQNYIPFLIDFCKANKIDALIPTIDTDLLLLAENKNKFNSTRVIISNLEKVMICRDKRFTADYFISLGLKSPSPVDDFKKYIGTFPAFIKPKDGSSSINAYKANNEDELKAMIQFVPDYIIQPYVRGTEFTVDIFCDFFGKPIFITPRIRLAVRGGEVLKTQIIQDQDIINEMELLIEDFKPCGPITVQLIRDNETQEDYYIEINPRYGGGAPLSIMAGADSAEMMIRLLNGEKISYQSRAAVNGATFSRFDQSVRVK